MHPEHQDKMDEMVSKVQLEHRVRQVIQASLAFRDRRAHQERSALPARLDSPEARVQRAMQDPWDHRASRDPSGREGLWDRLELAVALDPKAL